MAAQALLAHHQQIQLAARLDQRRYKVGVVVVGLMAPMQPQGDPVVVVLQSLGLLAMAEITRATEPVLVVRAALCQPVQLSTQAALEVFPCQE